MSQGKSCSGWASIGLLGLIMISRTGLLGLRRVSRKGLFGLGKHRAVRVKNGLKDGTARVEHG